MTTCQSIYEILTYLVKIDPILPFSVKVFFIKVRDIRIVRIRFELIDAGKCQPESPFSFRPN